MIHECNSECKAEKDSPYVIETIKDWEFKHCPLKEVDSEVYLWLRAYTMFTKGFLPCVGGWLDQSNRFIDVMICIDSIIKEKEVEDGRQTRNNFKS